MAEPAITRDEFWRLVRDRRYLLEKRRGKEFAYACMDGVNGVPGSSGLLGVPLEDNIAFLRLVSRAVRGGAQLCLHAARTKPLAPLFFDIDCKDLFATAGDEDTVCQRLYRLTRDAVGADAWAKHVGLPRMIAERFPDIKTVKDVFETLNANARTMATVEPLIALCDVFKTDPESQNWLNRNLAVAFACAAQSVVKQYYPSMPPSSPQFTCFAFGSHSEEPAQKAHDKCRVGAHLHFSLVVSVENAQDIGAGLEHHLRTQYDLGGMVDNAVHGQGLRLPYNFKPASDTGGKRKYDADGFVQIVRRYYKAAAVVKPDGTSDLTSKMGRAFLHDVLVGIMAANPRSTSATNSTPGFDNTGLPTAPHEPPKLETAKDAFEKMEGVTPYWRARVRKFAEEAPEQHRDTIY
jgi:hypothetical protein